MTHKYWTLFKQLALICWFPYKLHCCIAFDNIGCHFSKHESLPSRMKLKSNWEGLFHIKNGNLSMNTLARSISETYNYPFWYVVWSARSPDLNLYVFGYGATWRVNVLLPFSIAELKNFSNNKFAAILVSMIRRIRRIF